MITPSILQSLKDYTARMQQSVTLVLQTGDHPKRAELQKFLADITAVSPSLDWVERDTLGVLRSPISFLLEVEGQDTGIRYSGIPSGHEFNSLILGILQASGSTIKLDDYLKQQIAGIGEPLRFEVFVSLSCHNCPEVVQALQQFALLNTAIETEMIDGGLFQDLIAERDIQGVPSVYLNGKPFAQGKVTAAELMEKLLNQFSSDQLSVADSILPVQDVVVIGGGPAGVSSAIYSARKGLSVTIVADRIGGQVKDTLGIENLISVPKTTGPELSSALLEHLYAYDINLREHLKVSHIDQGEIKKVTLSSGEMIQARALIIATGAKWRELGIPGERDYIGKGVAYCPHCDGPFFKGREVAVIGGGNAGIEAALDLSGIAESVTVLEFMDTLKADRVLVDQANKRSNIKILTGVAAREIIAEEGRVCGIEYLNRKTNHIQKLSVAGVFVQIGLVPNSRFSKSVVEQSAQGEIVVNDRCETSATGIFAAGDVTTVPYKQIIVSMGEGAKAALSAFEYLLVKSESLPVDKEDTQKTAANSSR